MLVIASGAEDKDGGSAFRSTLEDSGGISSCWARRLPLGPDQKRDRPRCAGQRRPGGSSQRFVYRRCNNQRRAVMKTQSKGRLSTLGGAAAVLVASVVGTLTTGSSKALAESDTFT